jgi:hypothetical protein
VIALAAASINTAVIRALIPKRVPNGIENGSRSDLRGQFQLVAGTGLEPATSGFGTQR